MTKLTLTRRQITELHHACALAAGLPGVTTKFRYAALRTADSTKSVVEQTMKSHPRPSAPGFDAAVESARKDGGDISKSIAQAEIDHASEVAKLKAWAQELDSHLDGSEEVDIYKIPIDLVGDLTRPETGTIQRGLDAGRLTFALMPMIAD